MAENGQDVSDQLKNIAGSRPSSATKEDSKARLKSLKDRENEERYKKLEELRAQAMAAQRFKDKKEMERRQRIDDLRNKEDVRRHQVEERKKAINDAERDRLESILKRNQEREARIEAKKRNERHSMVFAFGSSTPRMLEPTDSVGSFWGHRRATSTQNITCTATPLTRRQSERELDGGSKKRATSAGGLERSVEDMRMSTSMYEIFNWGNGPAPSENPISNSPIRAVPTMTNIGASPQVPAGCASGYIGRRRTDLMPTIPSRDSPSAPPRKSFTKSPGRAYSMSRLDQLSKPRKRPSELPSLAETTSPPSFRPLNRPQSSSVSRSMSHLAVSKLGPQPHRPLRKSDSRSMHQLTIAVPLPPPRTTRASQLRQQKLASANHEAPSRPSSSLSQQSTSSITSSVNMRSRPIAAPRRQRPISIAVTGISSDMKNGMGEPKKSETKPPLPKTRKSNFVKSTEKLKKRSITSPTEGSPKPLVSPTNVIPVTHSPVEYKSLVKETKLIKENKIEESTVIETKVTDNAEITESNTHIVEQIVDVSIPANEELEIDMKIEEVAEIKVEDVTETEPRLEIEAMPKDKMDETSLKTNEQTVDVKPEKTPKIEKEDSPEVKIQEVQREKSQEKSDLSKAEIKLESENGNSGDFNDSVTDMSASMMKIRINTEEEAKAALAERRRLAREEAERQAEMERRRVEEEQRLEFERQQKEEEQQRVLIEKLRAAEQERLEEAIREAQKREEEERFRREEEYRMKLLKEEAERKAKEEAERQKAELQERLKNEEKEREARRKRVEAIMLRTRGKNNSSNPSQTDEKSEDKPEKLNGSKIDAPENGHKNEKEIETVNNIIPVESLKNANTVNVDNLSTDDTINSNNAW